MSPETSPQLLWLEGVNFTETLQDTTTLSVIRGASLALLAAPDIALSFLQRHAPDAGYEKLFGGASIALFRANRTADAICADAEALLKHLHDYEEEPDKTGAKPPLAHLRFVVGTAADEGTAAGPALAQARARAAQLSGHLPRRAQEPGQEPCLFSQQRVADTMLKLSQDHAARFGAKTEKVPVSRSALARWYYGRDQRQNFYLSRPALRERLGAFRLTDNLQDMVDLSSRAERPGTSDCERYGNSLPFALFDKLALVYADGNGFGHIRRAMGGTPEALAQFSTQADEVVSQALAAAFGIIAGEARARHRAAAVFHNAEAERPEDQDQLRFETLLYGGDEIAFVAPAWFGLAMAAEFFTAVQNKAVTWKQGCQEFCAPLTFSMGLALVNVKMPIRASYELAEALSKSCKPKAVDSDATIPLDQVRKNRLAIHAFEGIEPPGNGLQALRNGLFGETRIMHGGEPSRYSIAHPLLALDGDSFARDLAHFAALKADGSLPRSQLFRMLAAAQWPDRDGVGFGAQRKLNETPSNAAAAKLFKAYMPGHGAGRLPGFAACLADNNKAAMAAWLMTHLWDYVAPLKDAES
jgi:hypothetical protein